MKVNFLNIHDRENLITFVFIPSDFELRALRLQGGSVWIPPKLYYSYLSILVILYRLKIPQWFSPCLQVPQ